MPQNWGISIHGGQKRASESGQVYARWAEAYLRIGAGLCTVGRSVPQNWGRFMHGVQKRASELGLVYAREARPFPDFRQIIPTSE